MATCKRCGGRAPLFAEVCDPCVEQEYRDSLRAADPERVEDEAAKVAIAAVTLTTTPQLEGYRVVRTVDIVTAECAFGMNMFRDLFAAITDIVGGRSESTQRVLRDARQTCLFELRREAHRVGANAVIGVDLDYSEVSAQGKSMLFLVASGTAVRIEATNER